MTSSIASCILSLARVAMPDLEARLRHAPIRAAHSRLRRALIWIARIAAALALIGIVAAWISTDHFRAFGGAPSGARLDRIRSSPHFARDHFENLETTSMMRKGAGWGSLHDWLFGKELRAPTSPLPLFAEGARRLGTAPVSGLRVTWLGHSTALLEIDGARILTDPNWSERASPSRWGGPHRFHPPPIALADLPALDAVMISHEHYDHLDMATVRALAPTGVVFHVPLGIGAHLDAWGVPSKQIVEHEWWERATIAPGVDLVSTPARHFNGRGVPGRIGASWTSWAIVGPRHRVFFSGDTGLTESMNEIAAREGPFDVALLEIGQYHPSWGDIHLGPLGALEAHARLRAKALVPIHWGTFQLAYHGWSEPAETLVHEATSRGVLVFTPRLGEPIEPSLSPTTTAWWR